MITDIIQEIVNVLFTLILFTFISLIVYRIFKYDMSNFKLTDDEYDEDN